MVSRFFLRSIYPIVVFSLFSANSYASHNPVDGGDQLIEEVDSATEITPEEQKDYHGKSEKGSLIFSDFSNFGSNLLWDNQEKITDSIYDKLSNWSIDFDLWEKSKDGFAANLTWETNLHRQVFLNGPARANQDKAFGYYELNSLKTKFRLGLWKDLKDEVGVDFAIGGNVSASVSAEFRYAKRSEIQKLTEFRKIAPMHATEFDEDLAPGFKPAMSEKEQRKLLGPEGKKIMGDTYHSVLKNIDKVISFFEEKIEHLSENFVDDDKGKAYMNRLLDGVRLPFYQISFDGKILPVAAEKVLLMKEGELMFFTSHFDMGAGVSAKNGITTFSVNKPVRLSYHTTVQRLKGSLARLLVRVSLTNSWEVPRIETSLKASFGPLKADYDLFRYVRTTSKNKWIEFIYQYDLNDEKAKVAFKEMLRINPKPSFDLALSANSSSVMSLIGRRDSSGDSDSRRFHLELPFLYKFDRDRYTSKRLTTAYGPDQKTVLAKTVDGQTQINRDLKYDFGGNRKDEEERQIRGMITTNLDENGKLLLPTQIVDGQGKSQYSNATAHLQYAWQDKVTDRDEFARMTHFLQLLFGGDKEALGNSELRGFIDRKIPQDSRQAYRLELNFSQQAFQKILSNKSDEVWKLMGQAIFGSNVWGTKDKRFSWKQRYYNVSEPDTSHTCVSVGFIFMLNAYTPCGDLYTRADEIVRLFKKAKENVTNPVTLAETFNDIMTTIGEYPALSNLMVQLNKGFDGISYRLYLAGVGFDREVEVRGGVAAGHFNFQYGDPVPSQESLRDTPDTIRSSELFTNNKTGVTSLAIETSRFMTPEDRLFIEVYKFKPVLRDQFIARFQTKVLNPLPLPVDSKNKEDMGIRRYRYEVEMPEYFWSLILDEGVHTLQYLFTDPDLSLALSEVGEIKISK